MRRSTWLLVLGFGLLAPASAQQTPNAAPAFRAEGLYDLGTIDQVSMFNGGLSLQIPITTFGSEVQIPIVLGYSSSGWEATPTTCPPDSHICGADMKPKPTDRAGLGFKVTLGELYQPAFGSNYAINRWVYVSMDGTEHALYPTLHRDDPQDIGDPVPATAMFEPVMYSRDSSYTRVSCPGTNYPACTVETADGLKHLFQNAGTAQLPKYRLQSITDRFGNAVTVDYLTSPTRWRVRDGHSIATSGRELILEFFTPASEALDQPLLLRRIDLPCYVADGQTACADEIGSRTTWEFDYELLDTYPPSVYTQSPDSRPVWFLSALQLPDGSSYTMLASEPADPLDPNAEPNGSYRTGFAGQLKSMVLPTLGKLKWTWGQFEFPSVRNDVTCPAELPPNAQYWTTTFGVAARRQYDIAAATPMSAWIYTRTTDVAEPGVGEILTVTAESPLHDLSQYFFSIWAANFCYTPVHQTAQWEYGLPYSRAVEDSLATTPQRFLSAQHYDCPNSPNPVLANCSLERSVFQAWEIDDGDSVGGWNNGELLDRNRRMRSERIVFEDDAQRYKLRTMSDFDGLGHFRTTVAEGNFIAGHNRSSFADFNHDNFTYTGLPGQTYVPKTAGEDWILGTFSDQATTETVVNFPSGTLSQTAKEEFCFDANGFLTRHRRLSAATGARSTSDVLLVRTPDTDGNLQREQWYGGDGTPHALDTSQPACDTAVPATSRYWIEHSYQFGARATSQWRDAAGAATGTLAFLSLDRTIDGPTGLVRSVRDTSLLVTKFDYDHRGRIARVETPSAATSPSQSPAWETYAYAIASGANGATAFHRSFPTGVSSGTPLREEQWVYEGLGRLRRERRRAADNLFDDRFSFYDAAGHRDYLSEWGRDDTAGDFGLEWGDFDPFGRPGRVSRFSNDAFLRDEALLSYVGDRTVTRTQWIATTAPGGVPSPQSVLRVEWFDDHGRLQSVNEFSGGVPTVWTDYEYDVANRLRNAKTPVTDVASPPTQDRWWLFDQRGFLTSEIVPEKGAAGNGVVLHREYDPLGNSWNRLDGVEVGSKFDRAGRLTEVDEILARPGLSTIVRPMKTFTYSSASTGADYSLGKLQQAIGYNWIVVAGTSNFDARFRETFKYSGSGGSRSSREVMFEFGVLPNPLPNGWVPPVDQPDFEVFVHEEHLNALGLRSSLLYPTCKGATYQCVGAQPTRTLATGYTRGFLSTVTDASASWVSSATYHHSGLWNTMVRGNTMVETQLQDALAIARPASIQAMLATTTLWKTGTHEYDPSGNLTRLIGNEEGGTDLFLYDRVSRLKEARVQVPVDLGKLIFADGFESKTTERWLAAWPPAGWSSGQKTQNFTFDRFGNLTQVLTTGQSAENFPTDTTASSNRLSASIATYDDRGNLTLFGGATNTFDALSRQWKRLNPDGSADYYLYTADDERILTYAPTSATSWHWVLRDFGGKVLRKYELVAETAPFRVVAVQDYIHAGDRVLGTQDPRNSTPTTLYATVDHLGTPRLWTNSLGSPTRKLKYYPFGKEATPSDQWNIALQFTGHERDRNDIANSTDDGDYFHARFGSPITGRMLSVDPVVALARSMRNPQGWNRYAYVRGNPLKSVDRDGKLDFTVTKDGEASAECDATCEETKKKAYAEQERLRQLLTPGVKDFYLNALGVDLDALLKPGAGPTVQLANGDRGLSDLVGDSNDGRGPIKLNLGLDLFGGEGKLFQAALLHETAHYALRNFAKTTFKSWLYGPVDDQLRQLRQDRLSRSGLRSGVIGLGDGPEGHAAELLQFGDILTITLTEE